MAPFLRRGLRIGLAICVASATLPLHRALADCANDNECKGNRICEGGQCVTPPAPTPAPSEPVAPERQPADVPKALGTSDATPSQHTVSVRITTPRPVTISADGQTCVSPCTLLVADEKSVLVDAQGFGNVSVDVHGPTEVRFRRGGAGGLVAGLVMAGVGVPLLIGGILSLKSVNNCRDALNPRGYSLSSADSSTLDDTCGTTTLPYTEIISGGVLSFLALLIIPGGAAAVAKVTPEVRSRAGSDRPASSRFRFAASPTPAGFSLGIATTF